MIDHDEMPETEVPADPWSALLPGQELVPAYLTSRFAAQYRVIVDVLLAEQDTSLTGLSYDEVATGVRARLAGLVPADKIDRLLAPEVLHLDARLERLVQWRVLTRWQEPARSGEDFLCRRDRYQLTPRAAAARLLVVSGRHRGGRRRPDVGAACHPRATARLRGVDSPGGVHRRRNRVDLRKCLITLVPRQGATQTCSLLRPSA